jgi:hypothetical protein
LPNAGAAVIPATRKTQATHAGVPVPVDTEFKKRLNLKPLSRGRHGTRSRERGRRWLVRSGDSGFLLQGFVKQRFDQGLVANSPFPGQLSGPLNIRNR